MNFFKKSLLALTLCAAGVANATVIDFNSNTEGYFQSSITSQGFTVTPKNGDSKIGAMSNFDSAGMTNGTTYMGLWTNSNITAASFTLTSIANAAFSLQSFDFDNAYTDGSQRTSSLTIVGTRADSSTISQTISGLSNVTSFQTYLLNTTFQNLTSVSFTATGATSVRALFDNIKVNAAAAAVPEPASLALLGLGFLGLAAARKKKQA